MHILYSLTLLLTLLLSFLSRTVLAIDSKTITLTDDNFKDNINNGNIWLIQFSAPW